MTFSGWSKLLYYIEYKNKNYSNILKSVLNRAHYFALCFKIKVDF